MFKRMVKGIQTRPKRKKKKKIKRELVNLMKRLAEERRRFLRLSTLTQIPMKN